MSGSAAGGTTRQRKKMAVAAAASTQPATKKKATPKPKGKATQKASQPAKPLPYTSALLLTVREAATLLRISERKMYYLMADEIITALKIDRSTRIKRSVIDNYIATLELERVSA